MPRGHRRVGGHRQHEGDTAQPGLRGLQVDDVEGDEAEHPLAVRLQAGPAAARVLVRRAVPRGGAAGHLLAVDRDGVRQMGAVVRHQFRDGVPGEEMLAAGTRTQRDRGAGLGALGVGGGRAHRVAAVGAAVPQHRGLAGAAGGHLDGVGDHEAGQQPDAELAEELVPGEPQFVALGAAADRGEQLVDLRLRQADAVVLDRQGAVAGGVPGRQGYPAGGIRAAGVRAARGGDRVHRVLQQLAGVHLRAGVEVMAQQVDDPAQIDTEGLAHGLSQDTDTAPEERAPQD